MKNIRIKRVSEIELNGIDMSKYTQYLITSDGTLFSLKSGKSIKAKKEYYQSTLYGDDGSSKVFYHHTLVCAAFCSEPKTDKHNQVLHLDGDNYNNDYTNLVWASKEDISKNKKMNTSAGNRAVVIVNVDTKDTYYFKSLAEGAKTLGLNYSCCYSCLEGHKRTHRGYKVIAA